MDPTATLPTPPRARVYELATRRVRLPRAPKRPFGSDSTRYVNSTDKASCTGQYSDTASANLLAQVLAGHADTYPARSAPPSGALQRDPVLCAMLDGLKEIERLRGALGALLYAVESGRYGAGGLRMLVRSVCASALRLTAEDDRALEQLLTDLPAELRDTGTRALPEPPVRLPAPAARKPTGVRR